MYARCGIATEKVHTLGRSREEEDVDDGATGRRRSGGGGGGEHRERESWSSGKGSIRPGQSVTMSLV